MENRHVYVITTVRDGAPVSPVKVGITSNVESRLATLRTANPQEIALFCCLTIDRETASRMEREVHKILGKHRMRGEWFDVDPLEAAGALCVWFIELIEQLDDEKLRDILAEKSGLRRSATKLVKYHEWKSQRWTQ